jgi:hypothetical protein
MTEAKSMLSTSQPPRTPSFARRATRLGPLAELLPPTTEPIRGLPSCMRENAIIRFV